MRTALFDYDLPSELIARLPPAERDGGRLLVLGPTLEHRRIPDLTRLKATINFRPETPLATIIHDVVAEQRGRVGQR